MSSKQIFKNNAASTLNGTLAIGGTTINLPSGHGSHFPTPSAGEYVYVTLYEKDGGGNEITYEIVKVTAITGDSLTVVRDIEGLVVAAGGTSGGWAYPSAVGVNPSRVVYIELRYTAYAANNNLTKDSNLEGLGSASTARTNLGLGTIATQNANNVAITGGTMSGVTLEDSTMIFADNADNTKKMQFQLSSIGTGMTRTITVPNSDITLPGVNVANTWAAAQTFSSTLNKVTITAPATGSTLTIANGKTLTASNTLTFTGTDGSTLNVGTGGTLGTAAYTATTAYAPAFTSGTQNYVWATPNGSSGVPSLRALVAADIPTLNQNTTGSAAKLTTPRAIYGNNFDGSAALTGVIASTYGGTGNGFTKFTGPTTAEKTFTLPDANSTLAALGTAQSWTAAQTFDNSTVKVKGSSTGVTTFTSANAGASNYTITIPAVTGTLAVLGANTFTGAQVHSDQQVSRAMFLDCGYTVVDKGNISNATVTFDYTGGSIQTYTATGSTVTWAFSNWPPTGNLGELLVIGTNMGAYTHSISGITWLNPNGTTTTSVATYLAALTGRTAFQTSGVDQIYLWTRDAGTTIYGKLI